MKPSVKDFLKPLALLAFAASVAFLSHQALGRRSLAVFVLRAQADAPKAFRVRLSLAGAETSVEPLNLSGGQERRAREILGGADAKGLAVLAGEFGEWSAVVGVRGPREGWPWYLGAGWRALWDPPGMSAFDNLGVLHRCYLALAVKAPAPVGKGEEAPLVSAAPETVNPVPAVKTPALSPAPAVPEAVRVEILNGCGIKGAADWAAGQVKGDGIDIVKVDNAANFHFQKSTVETSAGMPEALKSALGRLGIPPGDAKAVPPSAGKDATIVIGRDYRKLRGLPRK